jgi:hypothetical protein
MKERSNGTGLIDPAHLPPALAGTFFEHLCGFRQGNCILRLTVHQESAWFAEGDLITKNELFLKLFEVCVV